MRGFANGIQYVYVTLYRTVLHVLRLIHFVYEVSAQQYKILATEKPTNQLKSQSINQLNKPASKPANKQVSNRPTDGPTDRLTD